MSNPFDGVTPDFGAFGTDLQATLQVLLGGLWAIALIAAAFGALIGLVKWALAKKQNRSDDMTEAAGQFKISLIVFGVTVAIAAIFGAIIFILQ
jgi:hypothetical protein